MRFISWEALEPVTAQQAQLAEKIAFSYYRKMPERAPRYRTASHDRCLSDVRQLLMALAGSVWAGEPSLFVDYLRWHAVAMKVRGLPGEHLAAILETMSRHVSSVLDEELAARAGEFLEEGIASIPQVPEPSPCLTAETADPQAAETYLGLLLAGDRGGAERFVLACCDQGMSVENMYLDILQPVLHEVGRLWQIGKLNVAQEHFCTSSTRQIMNRLFPLSIIDNGRRSSAVATSVTGELHDLGIRMVADCLMLRGWNVHYLGADLQTEDLVFTVASCEAKLLAVSITMLSHLRWLTEMISLVRSWDRSRRVRIIVGGHPFNVAGELWKRVGADGAAANAQAAADLVDQLC